PVHALVVAVVVLEVVHAPGGERVRVGLLVVEAAGEAGARGRTGALVDAEFQTLTVYVVRDAGDAVRELVRVGHEMAGGVAGSGHPAVVDVDVLVPGRLHPRADHDVGGLLDQRLVDVAAERVPVVPAHRRGEGEPVAQRVRGGLSNQDGGDGEDGDGDDVRETAH